MAGESHSRLRTWIVSVLLALGTAALFSRSMTYGYINFDDGSFVANNPYVQRGLTWEGVRWAFDVDRDLWHPITWLSFMLDCELFGDNPRAFHIVNIAWHALNGVLVFLLARRMTGTFWTAAICAALFAWHPQRVESVTWITERKDVLSGFFSLIAIGCHLAYGRARMRNSSGFRAAGAYTGALAAFALGLMSKSVVVMLPVVLLLLDLWPLGRGPRDDESAWRTLLRLAVEKVPFLALALAAGLITMTTQEASGAFSLALSFDQRVGNALVSVMRYLGMAAWPYGLSVMYPHPGDWPALLVGGAGLAVAAISVVACWTWRERPWLLVGWGWFLAFLLPTLGLVQVGLQAMADRYTYLPMIGLQLALLELARRWVAGAGRRARAAAAAAAVVVLAALGFRTVGQQALWRDAESLFGHAIRVTRGNYVAHTAMALQRLSQGRVPEAAHHAETAVTLAPELGLTLEGLGSVRLAQGRVEEAIQLYRDVIRRQPGAVSTRCDLGRILLSQGRTADAEPLFAEALALKPASVAARLGLAEAALMRGNADEAIGHLLHARELAPRDGAIALHLASVQLRTGRDAAATTLHAAVELGWDDAGMLQQAGDMLGKLGRMEDALRAYERGVVLAPADATAHVRLGYAYFLLKRPADAIRSWETALRLDPTMTDLERRIRQARAQLGG